ncbi:MULTISPECIES: alpha/beta fold hydrolase [unclassified Frankia]|uniref:alpha/beta fold hydrolase n=1 Tax=unclassified Frankia TaxID=2632575 RepID=UPI001EF67159|nr:MULTISPECIES: alpha/beta hydrolase [unclassified Frankia]
MGTVQANGIEIAYELHGDPSGLPLLIVSGLGQQLVGWHPDLLRAMVRRGFQVVVYDNRDVGLSSHFGHLGQPDLMAALSGDAGVVPYRLLDMAADAAGLMDALGWESAHIFGISMGGMIAQTLALRFPGRVRSLTSASSTTGNHAESWPTPAAAAALLRPAAADREAFMDGAEEAYSVIGSGEFPYDRAWVRERAGLAWDRGYDPQGPVRQLIAILVAEDRTAELGQLTIPTLVVHGTNDPLIPVAGGRLTAAAVPAAELLEIDGMGHDLPRQVWERLLDKIDDVVHRGEAARSAGRTAIA